MKRGLVLGIPFFWLSCIYAQNTQGKPAYLFAHGIADSHKQAYWFSNLNSPSSTKEHAPILYQPFITFDFPDVTSQFWRVNFTQSSLAQTHDIMAFSKAFKKTTTIMPHRDLVLMGLSRGAATVLNYVALYNPAQVKALILESPYDSIETIVQNKLRQIGMNGVPWVETIAQNLVGLIFWKYHKNNLAPRDIVRLIPKDLPILIICSKEDPLVPWQSSYRLYELLQESNHLNTHIVLLNKGKHAKLWFDEEKETYLHAVHAFYKKYNLPYDEKFAYLGLNLIN